MRTQPIRPRARARAPFAALALLSVLALPVAAQGQLPDPRKLVFPPLRPIPAVHPERYQLPNGGVVYLLENHDLPVVTGTVYFHNSPSAVPADKVGLGTLTGQVMRSGGTARHPGDWLDDHLAALGAEISTDISGEMGSGGFRCLRENTAEIVGLWAEVLRQPAFPENKIELAKVGLRRAIASRNDEMIPLLMRTAGQAVYGKESPYARTPEYRTVEAIRRADCERMHRLVFDPGRMILAIYGDFRSAEMKRLIAAQFGPWKGAGEKLPPDPPIPGLSPGHVVFAPKEDVTQSGIILAHIGFKASEPDYPDMSVLENALGGGFQSRLVNHIRTQRGLAYSTGAQSGADFLRPGVFAAYSLTKSESTLTAASLVRQDVELVTREPVSPEELKVAQETAENSFVFNFENPSEVLFRSAFYEFAGYPADFLQRYQKALQNVTAQSMLAAAQRHIHPASLITVIVGKESDFERPLTSLGQPVERVDISIPPPPSKVQVGQAGPDALKKGQDWLRKAATLAGGTAAWQGVKSAEVSQSATLTMQGQTIPATLTTYWVLPEKTAQVQKLAFGEFSSGFDGKSGWMKTPQGVQDNPEGATSAREGYERSLFHLFAHPEEVPAQALPEPQTIDGVKYNVAYVKSDQVRDWMLYFAPGGELARMEFQNQGPQGPAKQTMVFADWQPVGKIRYPHTVKMFMNGQPLLDSKVTTARFNVTIPEATFKKPAS